MLFPRLLKYSFMTINRIFDGHKVVFVDFVLRLPLLKLFLLSEKTNAVSDMALVYVIAESLSRMSFAAVRSVCPFR